MHTDGVDLGLIGPPWLTIGLFMAITGVYAALLTLSGEPLLKENSWVAHAPTMLTAAPLALWIPLAPLLGILVRLLGVGRRDAPDTTRRYRARPPHGLGTVPKRNPG